MWPIMVFHVVKNVISLLFFGALFWDALHHRPFLFLVFCASSQYETEKGNFWFEFIFDFVPTVGYKVTIGVFVCEVVVGYLYRKAGRRKSFENSLILRCPSKNSLSTYLWYVSVEFFLGASYQQILKTFEYGLSFQNL